MAIMTIVGVDPGPVTGICEIMYSTTTHKYSAVSLIQADIWTAITMLSPTRSGGRVLPGVAVAAEAFVDGRRSGRVAGRSGSDATRAVLDHLRMAFQLEAEDPYNLGRNRLSIRSAGQIKPWATDDRLAAAGIVIQNPSTMRHALDAGRHALYSACFDQGCRDPLAQDAV